ncbi:MAG: hypothetical protein Kow0069_28880 [Promethearchaeota archaeon]
MVAHLLEDQTREYYLSAWGFDPEVELVPLDPSRGKYRYETTFRLLADPALDSRGLRLLARVDFEARERENRRWSFRRRGERGSNRCFSSVRNALVVSDGERQSAVECVHTAVYRAPAERLARARPGDSLAGGLAGGIDESAPAEGTHVRLSPEDHWAALRSFCAALVEVGVAALATTAYGPGPFRRPFNPRLVHQLLEAFEEVRPGVVELALSPAVARLEQEDALVLAGDGATSPRVLHALSTTPTPACGRRSRPTRPPHRPTWNAQRETRNPR